MALGVVWTRYGPEAGQALHDAVASAKGGDPLAPVTVVVPSNHVGVASRRLLASGRLGPVAGSGVGLAAVTFVTTYRLAELLGASSLAAAGRRPVSTPLLAAAMRSELADHPGLFGPVAEHPATESALVASYKELRDLPAASLTRLAGTSARAAEVVRLHRAARARLEREWYDEEDLLDAAVGRAGSAAAAELGAIVVHLPQRLSLHGAQLLVALAEHLEVTVLAGRTGSAEADAEVAESVRRLGGTAAPDGVEPPPVDAERTTIVTCSDSDDEVRSAVRRIVDAARSGTGLDRIAVLHASPEPYARLAHELLVAADVPTNGASVVPLAGRMAGRTILELLALPDHGFRRQDVFAWLTSAPVLVEGRWAPTAAWERISRDAAVVAGRDDWDSRLAQLAEAQDERAERYAQSDESPEWRAESARRLAERARSLRRFVLRLIDDLASAAAAPRTWGDHAAWARRHLDALLGKPGHRELWPDAERKAAERVELALDRLAALDDVEGPVELEVFSRTLELELETDLGRIGRFGDGVLVGSVEMGIGLDLDLVVVLGLAEGSFPSTVRDDSLLPDGERAVCDGQLGLRAHRVERQHRQLLAALAGAREQVLCVPRGDLRRSVERVPSRWVLDIATHLAEAAPARWWTKDLREAAEPWVQHVPSFDAGLRAMASPATHQEHRLRALLAGGSSLDASGDRLTSAAAEVLFARRSGSFTRFDGNLARVDVVSPLGSVMSPTRLERWAGCPHQYLVEDVLGAAPVENPEDELAITPIDRGNLVHLALERFIREVLERPTGPPGPAAPWSSDDRRRMQEIGAEECDRYERLGLTGRPIFWRRERRRILADLDDALSRDEQHRLLHGATPLAVELAFGFRPDADEGALPPVAITLPDGRSLEVRGRADRVDLGADGTIHVTDYKTGSSNGYKELSEENPVARGTKLQLPIYGLAGRLHRGDADAPVRASYWFVTRKGSFEWVGYEVSEAVLEETRATLGAIVHGIEAGVFPAHPEDNTSTRPPRYIKCATCDPDALGTIELRQQWERKRFDPALATYADLAEPIEVDQEIDASEAAVV